HFLYQETLPFHPNGLCFRFQFIDGEERGETYYSIGGGFVVQENQEASSNFRRLPYPIEQSSDLLAHCARPGCPISGVVWENERTWRDEEAIRSGLQTIWQTMRECIFRGCHAGGELPGGLKVRRRASRLNQRLLDGRAYSGIEEWEQAVKESGRS